MMITLSKQQRRMFAEKLIDFAHLASGALVFGHLISDVDVSFSFIITGFVILILGYIVSYQFTKSS